MDPSNTVIHRKQHRLATNHERLEHLRFYKLKLLARAGLIPTYLSNIEPPTCPGCAYGKSYLHPWCHKTRKIPSHYQIKPSKKSGEFIRFNQPVIPTTSLISNHKGNPTVTRYGGSNVFVDHYSELAYVQSMSKLDTEE